MGYLVSWGYKRKHGEAKVEQFEVLGQNKPRDCAILAKKKIGETSGRRASQGVWLASTEEEMKRIH